MNRLFLPRYMAAPAAAAAGLLDLADVPGLQLKLMSDDVVGADGAGASALADTSGFSGRDAAQGSAGSRPIIRRTGANLAPNGLATLEFDGGNDGLTGALPGGGTISLSAGLMIYLYCKVISLTTGGFNCQMCFQMGNSVGTFELQNRTNPGTGEGYPDSEYGFLTGNVRRAFGAAVTGWQLLTVALEPPAGALANFRFYKDGVQYGSTQQNWQATDIRNFYTLGNSGDLNVGFRGVFGGGLVANQFHDAATQAAVEASLFAHFNS